MKLKRKINAPIFITAIVLTTAVFLLGFSIGKYLAYTRLEIVESSQKQVSAFFDLFQAKTKSLNESTDYCNLTWDEVWKEKVEVGNVLAKLETRLGKDDPRITEQKKLYNEMQFKVIEIIKKIREECGYEDWKIILFFYTNKKDDLLGDKKLSALQGYALDTVYNRNPENVKIFSFDINAESQAITKLRKQYQIKSVPFLVSENKTYEKFLSRGEIEDILKNGS
ncbi:hypothetical protein HYV50_02880 [Candidatus Pacearchaeota archaeon]|nr:hypothetical protein [Candidatus Pacearchaeota archaeon]